MNVRLTSRFTIVELLIVVAVIIILLSLIQPALRRALDQAYTVHCLNNLRQLAFANISYEEDSRVLAGAGTGGARHGDWTQFGDVTKGVLWEYVGNRSVYSCTVDATGGSDEIGREQTYSVNNYINGITGRELTPAYIIESSSQCDNPSETLFMVEENDPRGGNQREWVIAVDVLPYYWVDNMAIWHLNSSNISFLDGHVVNYQWDIPDGDRFCEYVPKSDQDFLYLVDIAHDGKYKL